MVDVNVCQENIFHTKMMLKDCDLDKCLFGIKSENLKKTEQNKIRKNLQKEILERFYGRRITKI